MPRKSEVSAPATCNCAHDLSADEERKITPLEPEAHTTEASVPLGLRKCATLTPRKFVSIPDVCMTQTGAGVTDGARRNKAARRNRMARILPTFTRVLRKARNDFGHTRKFLRS
jgi:hypothetical protein